MIVLLHHVSFTSCIMYIERNFLIMDSPSMLFELNIGDRLDSLWNIWSTYPKPLLETTTMYDGCEYDYRWLLKYENHESSWCLAHIILNTVMAKRTFAMILDRSSQFYPKYLQRFTEGYSLSEYHRRFCGYSIISIKQETDCIIECFSLLL